MYATIPDRQGFPSPERRQNAKLRAIYEDVTEQLRHLFKSHDDWAGSSIDYTALRMVHERYRELTAQEVKILVTAIGDRQQHCVSEHRLTALYP